MGSQQTKYKQTPQSCFTLWTVDCNWKGRGGWTTFTFLKILLHSDNIQFVLHLWILHNRFSFAQESPFHVLLINRILVAQNGELLLSLYTFFCLLILPSRSKVPQTSTCTSLENQPKVDRRPPDFHLISLWMSWHSLDFYAFQRGASHNAFSDWDSSPSFQFIQPRR